MGKLNINNIRIKNKNKNQLKPPRVSTRATRELLNGVNIEKVEEEKKLEVMDGLSKIRQLMEKLKQAKENKNKNQLYPQKSQISQDQPPYTAQKIIEKRLENIEEKLRKLRKKQKSYCRNLIKCHWEMAFRTFWKWLKRENRKNRRKNRRKYKMQYYDFYDKSTARDLFDSTFGRLEQY